MKKDRIGRDAMYSYFKSAYPKSIITSTQLLNSLKDREILYAPNHRINNLRGCYLCVKYKDEFDDEPKSKSTNLKELDKDINDEFDDDINVSITQTKLTKSFKTVIKLKKINFEEVNEILNDVQNMKPIKFGSQTKSTKKFKSVINTHKIKSDDDDHIDTINDFSNTFNF